MFFLIEKKKSEFRKIPLFSSTWPDTDVLWLSPLTLSANINHTMNACKVEAFRTLVSYFTRLALFFVVVLIQFAKSVAQKEQQQRPNYE